jgi:hypothetical protein
LPFPPGGSRLQYPELFIFDGPRLVPYDGCSFDDAPGPDGTVDGVAEGAQDRADQAQVRGQIEVIEVIAAVG